MLSVFDFLICLHGNSFGFDLCCSLSPYPRKSICISARVANFQKTTSVRLNQRLFIHPQNMTYFDPKDVQVLISGILLSNPGIVGWHFPRERVQTKFQKFG